MRLLIIFLIFPQIFLSQNKHEHPDHPRGNNSKDQYDALPHYNEACELYANGKIEKAKASLKEAIDISFALTEAQLFLAKIYHEQGKIDSAFLYYNSGIDFAIHQKPHYYFKHFETGMQVEQYHKVKHTLKHFKKYFGKQAEGKYDMNYPYTVDDLQIIEVSLLLVENYQYWQLDRNTLDTLNGENSYIFLKNKLIELGPRSNKLISYKKNKTSSKALKPTIKNAEDIQYFNSGHNAIFTRSGNLYVAEIKGGKLINEKKLPTEINSEKWEGTPFYDISNKLLFFSSSRNGNKDLFVADYSHEENAFTRIQALDRINTTKDEISPVYVNGKFYFSSNGLPGFGGFDLYATEHMTFENKIGYPSDWENLGKPINTGNDETSLQVAPNGINVLKRTSFNGEQNCIRFSKELQRKDLNYNIRMTK